MDFLSGNSLNRRKLVLGHIWRCMPEKGKIPSRAGSCESRLLQNMQNRYSLSCETSHGLDARRNKLAYAKGILEYKFTYKILKGKLSEMQFDGGPRSSKKCAYGGSQ